MGIEHFDCSSNPRKDGVFKILAWFDNVSIPARPDFDFTTGSWEFGGQTVEVDYVKLK